MDGVKPWQLAVIIIGLVGGLGLVGWQIFGGQHIRVADSLVLADVGTGQLYRVDVGGRRGVLLPAKNPETGERTLLPVKEIEEGQWEIEARYMSDLDRFKAEQRDAVDARGRISGNGKDIRKLP